VGDRIVIALLRAWSLRRLVDSDDRELLRSSTGRDVATSDAWGCALIMRNNARRDRARELLRPRFRPEPRR
jgi:hypothetical protein